MRGVEDLHCPRGGGGDEQATVGGIDGNRVGLTRGREGGDPARRGPADVEFVDAVGRGHGQPEAIAVTATRRPGEPNREQYVVEPAKVFCQVDRLEHESDVVQPRSGLRAPSLVRLFESLVEIVPFAAMATVVTPMLPGLERFVPGRLRR